MKRLPLHQLEQSGATDGQAAVWSDADNAWIPGAGASSGQLYPMSTTVNGVPSLVFDSNGRIVYSERA